MEGLVVASRYLKRYSVFWLWLFVTVSITCQAKTAAQVRFALPNFPPYVEKGNNGLNGVAVDWLRRVLTRAGIPFAFYGVPNYGRALTELRVGRADAFMVATKNAERDSVATFLRTPFRNRWCWFVDRARVAEFSAPEAFRRPGVTIGTVVNTNTQYWLDHHGYSVGVAAASAAVLPRLLLRYRRLDAVLLSEDVFVNAATVDGISPDRYQCLLNADHPFGIYISHAFIHEHPDLFRQLRAVLSHALVVDATRSPAQ